MFKNLSQMLPPLHRLAAQGFAFFMLMCLLLDQSQAATLSLTSTAGGVTLVGDSDAVSAFSFSVDSNTGQLTQHLDSLSSTIAQDVASGTLLSQIALVGDFGTFAFQNVLFTAFSVGLNTAETVSFSFGTFTSTPSAVPLPATLLLFATGLGGLGLLGWRRSA